MKGFTKSAERPAAIADKAAVRDTELAGTTNVVVATVLDSANHRARSLLRVSTKLIDVLQEIVNNFTVNNCEAKTVVVFVHCVCSFF
jgi:hypothetical protein